MKITKAWLFAALLAASAFACGDDDDDDDNAPDAAQTPDAPAMPDAEPPIDAEQPPDAVAPGAMIVTVVDDKFAIADVDVVFSNRDGTLISHKMTDSNGQATETVPGRAFITIFRVELPGVGPTRYVSYTLGGVMPGDDITINVNVLDVDDGGSDSLVGTVTIDWPGEHTGAAEYAATEGCELATEMAPVKGGPPNTTVDLNTACRLGGSTWHIVASALDDGDDMLAATFAKNVSASATVTLPAWNTNFEGPTVTLSNAPEGALAAGVDGSFTLDGVSFDLEDGGFAIGGVGSYDVLVPQGFTPDSTVAATFLAFPSGMSIGGLSAIEHSQAGLGADLAYDLVADALPGATDGTVSAGTRPLLSWLEGGDLSVANIAQISLSWDDLTLNEEHRWLAVTAPGNATPFHLPELPAALSDFAPAADTEYTDASAIYFEANYITDDWDTIRQNGGALRQSPADANFVQRFSFPFFDAPTAPANALPAMGKRLVEKVLGR